MAYQHIWGYFMSGDEGISFIVHLYFHFLYSLSSLLTVMILGISNINNF